MIDALLNALQYAGGMLEKPGRAVRGVLAGKPNEGLAAIPFSDALGITDEADRTSGADLLKALGHDPGDDLMGQAAGFGVDVATDPLTYFGGALAGKLLGRGGQASTLNRTAANVERDATGILSPFEREVERLHDAPVPQIPKALPPEVTGPRVMPPMAFEHGPAAGMADAVQGGGVQVSGVPRLHEVPDPRGYPMLGFNPEDAAMQYTPRAFGPAADAVAEGNPTNALATLLHQWDAALPDLERLTPEAKLQVTGQWTAGKDLPGGRWQEGRQIDPTLHGQAWRDAAKEHMGDLGAVSLLGAESGIPPELIARASDQLHRLGKAGVLGGGDAPLSSAWITAQDISRGRLPPAEVRQALPYLSHLPVDEAALRRMAAHRQLEAGAGTLEDSLGGLAHTYVGEGQPLRSILDDVALTGPQDETYLLDDLRRILDPGTLQAEHGIQGDLARRLFEQPPESLVPHLRDAREVLAFLEASPDVQRRILAQRARVTSAATDPNILA